MRNKIMGSNIDVSIKVRYQIEKQMGPFRTKTDYDAFLHSS